MVLYCFSRLVHSFSFLLMFVFSLNPHLSQIFTFFQGKLENYKEAATRVLLHWNQTIPTAQEAFRILREALLQMEQNGIVEEVLDVE